MAKYPCRRCIYNHACGDNSRTVECKGRTLPSDRERCVICGNPIDGWGNNPWPIKEDGQCCDSCNMSIVVPARIANLQQKMAGNSRQVK